ncbi:ubiquitin-specific protease doa4 [Mycoemilia scoparia]|uniref:ubiquitinyl hydrolase 1 n=1 Tax=Mycoemilia scoparia TaxID=417184 RepID=A0A9W7ZXK8_9FUNG|nr:ubiquitin-specific protease doa4 [Mycoemilia scoparia]
MIIIPRQGDYSTVKSNPKLKELRSTLSSDVVGILENLKMQLKERWTKDEKDQKEEERRKREREEQRRRSLKSSIGSTTATKLSRDADEFKRRYPEAPMNPVDDFTVPTGLSVSSNSISSHAPESGGLSKSGDAIMPALQISNSDNVYKDFHSRFDQIDNRAKQIDQSAERLKSVGSPQLNLSGATFNSSIASSSTNNRHAAHAPPTNSSSCTPEELQKWILSAQASMLAHRPEYPKILILDVRSTHEHLWGHIKAPNVVNIDPIGLREGYTSSQIENSLVLESERCQQLFRDRHLFDYVVYMDDSTQSPMTSSSTLTSTNPKTIENIKALRTLVNAIYYNEFEHPLRSCPMILIGGFQAWVKKIGDSGINWCSEHYIAQDSSRGVSGNNGQISTSLAGSGGRPGPVRIPSGSGRVGLGVGGGGGSGLSTPRPYSLQRVPSSEIQRRREAALYDENKADVITEAIKVQGSSQLTPFPSLPDNNITGNNGDNQYVPRNSVYDLFRDSQSYLGINDHLMGQQNYTYHQQQQSSYTTSSMNNSAQNGSIPSLSQFAQSKLSVRPSGLGVARRNTVFDDPFYAFTSGKDSVTATPSRPQANHKSVMSSPSISTINYPDLYIEKSTKPSPPQTIPSKPKALRPPEVIRSTKPQLSHTDSGSYTDVNNTSAATTAMIPLHNNGSSQKPVIPPKPREYSHYKSKSISPTGSSSTLSDLPLVKIPISQQVGIPLQKPATPGPAAATNTSLLGTSYMDTSMSDAAGAAIKLPSMDMINHQSMNIGITGLKNFGSTCYMNSVIQCLSGTLPFARYFMQGNWRRDIPAISGGADVPGTNANGSASSLSKYRNFTPQKLAHHFKFGKSKNDPNVQLVREFSRLLEHMWNGQYGSLSPTGFRDAIGALAPHFKSNEQQDCQEFASFLLDKLHETLNRVTVKPPPPPPLTQEQEFEFERLPDNAQSSIQWQQYMRRNWSIVSSIFQGQVQSRLRCLSCGQTSTTYSQFTELSVPIPSPPESSSSKRSSNFSINTGRDLKYSLYQCLDNFVEEEILGGENAWSCPRCKQKRQASKRLMISKLPLVLVVHLKRFLMHGLFRDKLESLVTFPIHNLDMKNYVLPHAAYLETGDQPSVDIPESSGGSPPTANISTKYRLYAVANHFGTLTGGHYTANVFSGHRNEWNNFDDTRASRVQESQIVTPAAYLLFFVRV